MERSSHQFCRRQFVRSGTVGFLFGLAGCLRFTNTDSDPQQDTTAGDPSVTAPATDTQTDGSVTATETAPPTRTTARSTDPPQFALEPITELESPVAATAHDGKYYTIGYPGVSKLAPDGTKQWDRDLDIENYYPKSGVALTDASILWGLQASDDVEGTTLGGKVLSFSRADGSKQWEFVVEKDGTHHQISGIGTSGSDVVAIGADDHGRGDDQEPHVYGVAPSTGEQVWKTTDLPAGHIETVVAYSGRFYIIMVGGIFACEPSSGSVRKVADIFSGFGRTEQAGRMLYLPGEPLRAFDLEQESVAWKGNVKGEVKTQPVYSDGRLFAGTDTGFVYGFATPEGSELWETRVPGEVEDVEVSQQLVWVTDDQEGLYAFQKDTGRQVIERPEEQADGTQPLQDTVLVLGSNSSIKRITTV